MRRVRDDKENITTAKPLSFRCRGRRSLLRLRVCDRLTKKAERQCRDRTRSVRHRFRLSGSWLIWPSLRPRRPGGRKPGEGKGCGRRSRRSEEHTSELQSHLNLVCRLLLEKKK